MTGLSVSTWPACTGTGSQELREGRHKIPRDNHSQSGCKRKRRHEINETPDQREMANFQARSNVTSHTRAEAGASHTRAEAEAGARDPISGFNGRLGGTK